MEDSLNSYTTSEVEEIFGITIEREDSAVVCRRALGSTMPENTVEDKVTEFSVDSVVEFTLNMPLTKDYYSLPYNEKVSINKKIFQGLIDKMKDNVLENMYYIENTLLGQPHLHGYIRFRFHHGIIPAGLLMDIAKIVLKNLTRGQYNKQYTRCNYNEKLRRFKSPALCLNYKNLLGDKWLSYISKGAVRSDDKK